MPGLLSGLTGTIVREFTFIGPADAPSTMDWNGKSLPAGIFNDVLEAEVGVTQVLAAYETNYYAGSPAMIEHRAGKGRVIHFGGTFQRETVDAILKYLDAQKPWRDVISLPEACEIAVRERDGERYFIVLNYSWDAVEIELLQALIDVDDGQTIQGKVCLNAFETKVYRMV